MKSTIELSQLQKFASEVLANAGLQAGQAAEVARVLVWADARGTHSHGVARLKLYTELLQSGEMNGAAKVAPTLSLPAFVTLEADRSAGAVAMTAAADHAVACAKRCGIGMAIARDTTHTGALGYYTSRIAAQGLCGIAGAASGPHMAYHNAATAGVSTGPISIAAPGPGAQPIVFDMASSVVALGKLQQAKAAGKPIPADWAIDALGRPTTDAAEAKTPLPLGGPKGSGLALMLEVLSSLLAANPILAPALHVPPNRRRHYQNGFVIAIDIAQVTDPGTFSLQAEALVSALKHLPASEGQEILMPGERGARQAAAAESNGVALPPPVLAQLDDLAGQLGVPPLNRG